MTDIEIILRNCEGLAHHAAYGILSRAAFQSLGVSEEHGAHQFHFAHKHLQFTDHRSHQTEIVFAASQLDLYANLVDHVAILEKDVGMQTTQHIERATLQSQSATLYQTVVRRVVRKIHTVHPTRAVLVEQSRRQLGTLCIFAITQ